MVSQPKTPILNCFYHSLWFYFLPGLTLASKLASSSSCALFWVKWCWLGMWGIGVRPDTDYDLAKQLNSETVKK